jgi:RimJ/RimL family protein N-acetyltransferase
MKGRRTACKTCREWVNDPDISKGILRVLPVTMYEHMQWYETVIRDKSRVTFAIETLKEKSYIGNTGLADIDWRNRKGRLWIYLDKSAWNKGYGKEAVRLLLMFVFNSLNLNKVYINVALFNKNAIKMYKAVGFKEEGTLKEEVYIDGLYVDVLRMSVLRKDTLV